MPEDEEEQAAVRDEVGAQGRLSKLTNDCINHIC